MAPLFEFDPTSEDAANSPLEIWNTSSYAVTAVSWPAPPLSVQWASSVDTEGSLPASRKHENRTISITVDVLSAAALRALQAKFAKITREGGTAKITYPNGEVIVLDLHAGDTFDPQFDITYYVNSGTFCTVQLTLLAKSYGRGAEVTILSDHAETTLPHLVFTETGLKGDIPGLGRLVIDNDNATDDQRLLVWGIQSRYYSSASTAALFYQAESCAMNSAAVATGPAGASGGATNNTAFYGSLPAVGTGEHGLIYIGASSTAQTHVGTFRLFARARVPSANSGIVGLRASWYPAIGRALVSNDSVWLENSAGIALADQWLLADLGEITIAPARAGTQGWLGYIAGESTVVGDDVYVDWVMLVPVLEGTGRYLAAGTVTPSPIAGGGSVHVRHDSVLVSATGGYLSALDGYEGDYLLIPPAGLEGRTLRVIAKMSRGNLGIDTDSLIADPQTDDISAKLFYTPRYLVVPEP